jgi:hypothetical protein
MMGHTGYHGEPPVEDLQLLVRCPCHICDVVPCRRERTGQRVSDVDWMYTIRDTHMIMGVMASASQAVRSAIGGLPISAGLGQ